MKALEAKPRRLDSCRSQCHGICESEKGEERRTGVMFKSSWGGIPRKQGLELGGNTVEYEETLVLGRW